MHFSSVVTQSDSSVLCIAVQKLACHHSFLPWNTQRSSWPQHGDATPHRSSDDSAPRQSPTSARAAAGSRRSHTDGTSERASVIPSHSKSTLKCGRLSPRVLVALRLFLIKWRQKPRTESLADAATWLFIAWAL